MVRILIADDHAVVRGGLRQFLAGAREFEIAGEAGTGKEALALVRGEPWDLMLLDLGLPDLDGIEVLKRVKAISPDLPVLIFSMREEDDFAMVALEAGAAGYLPKDSPPEEILDAIRRASRRERYVSPHLAEKFVSGTAPSARRLPHESLSPRELEVMRRLSRGESLNEIGRILCLSPKTITTYRARVLEKLDVKSNVEIARYVIEHKLEL